jgi:Xaa-Pro aminopeptidase
MMKVKLGNRGSMLKVQKDSPKERRQALAGYLQENDIDLAIISNPKHIFYFTGFPSNLNMYLTLMKGPRSTSFLAVRSDGSSDVLLGKGEVSNPWSHSTKGPNRLEKIFDGEVTTYSDYDLQESIVTFGDHLSREMSSWLNNLGRGFNKIGIEEWHLANAYRSEISKTFDPEFVHLSGTVQRMRYVKGKDEIENLVNATKMLDFAYKFAKLNSKPRKSEIDVYREMNYEAFKKYGPFGWIVGDHVSGERSLEVGGWATRRVFKRSDTIVLDLQAAHNNYWSDLCRTFVIGGKASKKQQDVWSVLAKSLDRAAEVMAPGVTGEEIYEAANRVITSAGYPSVPHHIGHSIGLDDQERPFFLPTSDERLEEGMVCVVEPGIYMVGVGGIRLEDAYVVTKNGNQRISHFSRSLV